MAGNRLGAGDSSYTAGMRLGYLVGLSFAALMATGCSSGDDSSQKCSHSDDCPAWACKCGNGTVGTSAGCVLGKCQSGADACGSMCNGDVASYEQLASLKGTAECTEVCSAVAAAGCAHGSCTHDYCDIASPACDASMRAYLQCLAANVTWSCDVGFPEPVPSNACAIDNSSCVSSSDAGSD